MPPFQGGDTGSSPVGATIVGKTSSAMTRSFAFSPCMYRDGKRACAGDLPFVDSADALSEGLADLSCLFDVSEGALTGLFHLFLRLDCALLIVQEHFRKWCLIGCHLEDPTHVTKSLRLSIEYGHANNLSNENSSVAYWYQLEPHKALPPLPPVEMRIPSRWPEHGLGNR